MKRIERKKIKSLDELIVNDKDLDQFIKELQEVSKELKEQGFTKVNLDKDYYGYDGAYSLDLKGFSKETPKERKNRLYREKQLRAKEKEKAEKKRARDLKKLNELTKKYGAE